MSDNRTCAACGKTGGIYDQGREGLWCGACGAEVGAAGAAHARGRAEALEEAAAMFEREAEDSDRYVERLRALTPTEHRSIQAHTERAELRRARATRIRALVRA